MRVGFIGLGSIGLRRANVVHSLLMHNVIGFDYDMSAQGELLANGWQPVAHQLRSAPRMLAMTEKDFWAQQPEVVFICTPPDTHISYALDAVEQGRHIFVEKPLALEDTEAISVLIRLCEERSVLNTVACNWRFHEAVETIRRWITMGTVGELRQARLFHGSYLPDWVPSRDYGQSYVAKTGVLLDVGTHWVDLAQYLFGEATLKTSLVTTAYTLGLSCDGVADLLLKHSQGFQTSMTISFEQQEREVYICVVGTRGTVFWAGGNDVLLDSREIGLQQMLIRAGASQRMYQKETTMFLTCCERGLPVNNPIAQARKTLQLLLEAKNGR